MSAGFAHLHVHSDYSVLDGACKIYELLDKCEKFGMKACALTDHGNLFGAVEFYQAAIKKGIKPIIGCELYVAPTSRFDTETKYFGSFNNHFLALCENETGYHNLCKLSTAGYLEGFYYKPRVDDELLIKYKEGIIATTSCLAGRIPQAILNNNMDMAREHLIKYLDIFGKDNFLVELMDHNMPEQREVNAALCTLAEDFGLMTIATNDCHYLDKDDAEAHEALLAIQTGTTLEDERRFRFPNNEFYFCSPSEMKDRFSKYPEAVSNTEIIAERCKVEIPLGESLIPEYTPPEDYVPPPEGFQPERFLEDLVAEGLRERYGEPSQDFIDRANFELKVIEEMKFVDYFLVVWDLINYARTQEIPVGPGRGSGAGSIVAYCLHITNIDPMRYNLLFERFLNPERVSMPDFDIDFCYNRREEMIEYAYKKYGKENVSQIITFGRMLAKNVIRNVGRVMGMGYSEVDRIAKLIPDELKIKLKDAVVKEPELARMIKEDPQVAKLWHLAERLEGTIGNCGTHAAGVVICDHPLTDHIALYKAANSDTVATQVEMKCVEEVGLLKMDFLGLRTLTVVHNAVKLVQHSKGIIIDIDNISPDDDKTYQLLRSGQTFGVFQLESSGMRDLAKRIGLQSLEEMSALVALYRPGPMQFIDTYIEGKYNPDSIKYDHPITKPILEETYGIAVYQEQVMQLVQACGGFTLGQADIVRRAMGKKKKDLLDQQKVRFVEGCNAKGIDANLAQAIWDKIEMFAGYGFNKSHSVAYAFVAYQTAFLKANYPVEFMCALLTSESGNLDKVALYVEECRRMGIDVSPPDINQSFRDFTVVGDAICFGLGAIKNVGDAPTHAIVLERENNGPYQDIYDFCARLDSRIVNRRLIESLNKAGAFRSTEWFRSQVEAVLDQAISEGQCAQRDRLSGQTSLFDMSGMEEAVETLRQKPEMPEWEENDLLQFEKEILGLYASSHPLTRYIEILDAFCTVRPSELSELPDGKEVNIGGLIGTIKTHITGQGKKMAFVTLETLEGNCELTIFSDLFEQVSEWLQPETIVMIQARISYRNSEAGLLAAQIFPIEDAERHLTRAVHIRVFTDDINDKQLHTLAEKLSARPGVCDLYIHCLSKDSPDEVIVHATEACRIMYHPKVRDTVDEILGEHTLWFSAGMGLPSHAPIVEAPPEPAWRKRRVATV